MSSKGVLTLYLFLNVAVIEARITASANNQITSISVNNTVITGVKSTSWYIPLTELYTMKYMDVIEIRAVNYELIDDYNPGGIIASVFFSNESGNEEVLNTGSDWFCNGIPAMIVTHQLFSGTQLSGINGGASWIWSSDLSSEVICVGQIRKRIRIPTFNVLSRADDQIMYIKIGAYYIGSGPNCWTCEYNFYGLSYLIKSGDVIEFQARNNGGPYFSYLRLDFVENEWFHPITIVTSSAWSCANGNAMSLGGISIWDPYGDYYSTCKITYMSNDETVYPSDCY